MKGDVTMESNDYKIANISSNDMEKISELEKSLNKPNKDIVLIAYQTGDKAKG